jgi:hypothetical protein
VAPSNRFDSARGGGSTPTPTARPNTGMYPTPMYDWRTPLEKRANIDPVQRREGGVVWVGTVQNPNRSPWRPGPQDVFEPIRDAKLGFSSLPQEQFNKLVDTMDKWYGKGRWQPSWIRGFYDQAIDHAEYRLRSEGLRMDPLAAFDDLLGRAAERGLLSGGGGGGRGGGGGPTRFVDEQSIVDLTSASGARAFLEGAMQDYLGRRPMDDEYRNFMSALNQAQKESPSTSRTVRNVSAGGATQTSRTTGERGGGVVPEQLAREFAGAQEGAAETAVSTRGIAAFLELLGS